MVGATTTRRLSLSVFKNSDVFSPGDEYIGEFFAFFWERSRTGAPKFDGNVPPYMYERMVVPMEWVAERRDELQIVDVRDAWEFEEIGHVPGAVNVPFDAFRSETDGEAGMLPGAERFGHLVGKQGIDPGDDVVAYDDTHGVFAARFLVTAELYGHSSDRLHLLDGDYSAWNREYEIERGAVNPETTTYDAQYVGDSGPLIELSTVREAIDDPDVIVIDTREDWEFEEGHIPGAVQLDWRELVDENHRGLKPRTELERVLTERGITPDRRVLLYCNTARRISHTYAVLRWLGYPDLAFYEGSLTEWEAAGGPIETGGGR